MADWSRSYKVRIATPVVLARVRIEQALAKDVRLAYEEIVRGREHAAVG